jgi:hypothetical protein
MLSGVHVPDPKADHRRYLQVAREALLWKLDGLSDYDIRRPMTPTGTNLLGLIKHAASTELGYFGEVLDRSSGEPLPWFQEDAEPNADMWATADESRDEIVGLYHRAWAHSDESIETMKLDAIGHNRRDGQRAPSPVQPVLSRPSVGRTRRHVRHDQQRHPLLDRTVRSQRRPAAVGRPRCGRAVLRAAVHRRLVQQLRPHRPAGQRHRRRHLSAHPARLGRRHPRRRDPGPVPHPHPQHPRALGL